MSKNRPAILREAYAICGRRLELSEPAKVLLASVAHMDVSDYTTKELDDLERVCASVMAAARKEVSRRDDCVSGPWKRRRGGRLPVVPSLSRVARYRVVDVKSGVETYVLEPYQLDEQAILDLARVVRTSRWGVRISAEHSEYFPGRSLTVAFSE